MQKYQIIEYIGQGSFGKVYKATNIYNNEIVAFKVISKLSRTEKEIYGLRQECRIQQNLHHPNIIQMLDSFETEDEIVVVTEYADRELYKILGQVRRLPEERVKKISCDLVSALFYLYSVRVVHRDLKPQNILLMGTDTVKLCDFGFARSLKRGSHVLTSIKGTPLYMAPELIEGRAYDYKVDLWSLGCIIYELLVGITPFASPSILQLIQRIQTENVKYPSFISPECKEFLQGLLQKDPQKRITWPDLTTHPFIKNVINIPDNLRGATASVISDNDYVLNESPKHSIVSRSGQSELLAKAIQQIEKQERKLKLLQLKRKSLRKELLDGACASLNATVGSVTDYNGCVLDKKLAYSDILDTRIKNDLLSDSVDPSFVKPNRKSWHGPQRTSDVDQITRSLNNFEINDTKGNSKEEKTKTENSNDILSFLKTDNSRSNSAGPIENEEWIAFLQSTMEEIMEGSATEMKQQYFVAIVISPLQNPSTGCKVIEYVACLLSLPFVVDEITEDHHGSIYKVYLELKIVPNLIYSSKLITTRNKTTNDDTKNVVDLSADELQALECIYLLICHLVYAQDAFLLQFSESLNILEAIPLLQQLLLLAGRKMRIVTDILAILCQMMRVMPEHAEQVETIFLGNVGKDAHQLEIGRLLKHHNPTLKARTCTLLRLLARYSCHALQKKWTQELRDELELLTFDVQVKTEAVEAMQELKELTFYNQKAYSP